MQIFFNGRSHETPQPLTIAALLDQLQLEPRRVAVEVNAQLVPREQHATHLLREGDQLEVVTLAGGG